MARPPDAAVPAVGPSSREGAVSGPPTRPQPEAKVVKSANGVAYAPTEQDDATDRDDDGTMQ